MPITAVLDVRSQLAPHLLIPPPLEQPRRSGMRLAPPSPGHARLEPITVPRRRFESLIAASVPALERYARHFASQPADAQDLVQETCRKALEAYPRFEAGTNISAWLRCILRNLQRDRARQRRREVSVCDAGERHPAPERVSPPLWAQISDEEVARALAALPQLYRSIYVLRTVDQCSYAEIERSLAIPSGTVGTRLLRARQRMRELLLARLQGAAGSTEAHSPDIGCRHVG